MQEPPGIQVARHVRAQRTALKFTQEELAAELGVTHQHVSRIEGGHTVPSLDLLVRLSGRLGVSTDYPPTGQKTMPHGIDVAIRGDQRLSAPAKRHLIRIISELRGAA